MWRRENGAETLFEDIMVSTCTKMMRSKSYRIKKYCGAQPGYMQRKLPSTLIVVMQLKTKDTDDTESNQRIRHIALEEKK